VAPLVAAVVLALPSPAVADAYSEPLRTAVEDLPVATEVRTGYERSLFPHWVDADGDGCSTRNEVLLAEADDPPSVGADCTLSGGRWFSYYDGVSVDGPGGLDIDHMVPLAEAWDSGARTWATATRRRFANDLGDYRSLVAVTASANRSKGDRDPDEWLPAKQQCRYVKQWVAVKHRWRLKVNSAEKKTLRTLAAGCTNTTITVTLAR
jgi:hypothetical protein